jgi:hypothetical protein
MYYCLTEICNSCVTLIEANIDEKLLLRKLDELCKEKLSEKGIKEYKILESHPQNITYPCTYVISNRNISNRTEIHHVNVRKAIVKGWIYNSKKYEVVNEIKVYDVLPIKNIKIDDENILFKRYIYDINDHISDKKRKTYDGESLFLN